jgi:hypothetical protein
MSHLEIVSPIDYRAFSDSEDAEILSDIYCVFCVDNCDQNVKKVKCSNCKHLACIHYSRKVLLKTLGEKTPKWLCNDCVTYYAMMCSKIKNSRR